METIEPSAPAKQHGRLRPLRRAKGLYDVRALRRSI